MKKYAIWDLDNCLFDDSDRIPLIDWSTKDATLRYQAYHKACIHDLPGNRELFEGINKTFAPLFVTGRPESVRQESIAAILSYFPVAVKWGPIQILMRPDGDERSSEHLKLDLVRTWIGAAEDRVVALAFDDHRGIVEMYKRDLDIPAVELRIHDMDAFKGEHELSRKDSSNQARDSNAQAEYLGGPAQGARPVRRPVLPRRSAGDILREMAGTFDMRNSQYRDNSKMVPKMVAILFPNGVPSHIVVEEEWHLFELILVKLTRFATSELTHIDSVHDMAPYCAMIEAILQEKQQ